MQFKCLLVSLVASSAIAAPIVHERAPVEKRQGLPISLDMLKNLPLLSTLMGSSQQTGQPQTASPAGLTNSLPLGGFGLGG